MKKNQMYEKKVLRELKTWQKTMLQKPSFMSIMSKKIQKKMNNLLPEKFHKAITEGIKQMVRAVISGSEHTTTKIKKFSSLEKMETKVQERIQFYKKTAALEGGITGAGGFMLGLADLPLLLALKIKMLFEIAGLYGFDVHDYKERIYILYIFQLAFSSDEQRRKVYKNMANWKKHCKDLPEDIHEFDWRSFQQEYRDYIDLAKLAQLLPLVGAPVGFVVNYRLVDKLGITAMNAYRMRIHSTVP